MALVGLGRAAEADAEEAPAEAAGLGLPIGLLVIHRRAVVALRGVFRAHRELYLGGDRPVGHDDAVDAQHHHRCEELLLRLRHLHPRCVDQPRFLLVVRQVGDRLALDAQRIVDLGEPRLLVAAGEFEPRGAGGVVRFDREHVGEAVAQPISAGAHADILVHIVLGGLGHRGHEFAIGAHLLDRAFDDRSEHIVDESADERRKVDLLDERAELLDALDGGARDEVLAREAAGRGEVLARRLDRLRFLDHCTGRRCVLRRLCFADQSARVGHRGGELHHIVRERLLLLGAKAGEGGNRHQHRLHLGAHLGDDLGVEPMSRCFGLGGHGCTSGRSRRLLGGRR